MFKKLYKALQEVNFHDPAGPERLALKATEELGELAETIHWYTGYKNTDKNREEILDCACEEGVDLIICALAVLDKMGVTAYVLDDQFEKKLKKWKKKLDNKKK